MIAFAQEYLLEKKNMNTIINIEIVYWMPISILCESI